MTTVRDHLMLIKLRELFSEPPPRKPLVIQEVTAVTKPATQSYNMAAHK
jgi:hypothetical protein